MKSNIWDVASGSAGTRSLAKARRKSIAEILRAAYLLHTRDPRTRRAVKRVLR